MIVVFIHQNFPGQYLHLVQHFAGRPGNAVYFITQNPNQNLPGVRQIVYRKEPAPPGNGCHPFTFDIDEAMRTGLGALAACRELHAQGVRPDIIVGHSGWGETIFVKDVFPEVPLLANFEFFYHVRGVDFDFDPEFTPTFSDPARLRPRNAINFMAFDAADWGHTATRWQLSLYPPEMRGRITAIHEGVDTDRVRPNRRAWIRLARPNGQSDLVLRRDDEVVTYVSRNLEPYRGFHVFMRALPVIQRRRPRAHVVIVGGDGVSYGRPALPDTTYREMLLRELGAGLDLGRIHFLGQIPYGAYLNLLQVSSVHVHLTYPFVLSWSFVEALASGCAVVGSATPPVLEVLEDGVNGLAVDFFSPRAIADRVDEVLNHRDRMQPMRERARRTAVEQFDLKGRQLPLWLRLLEDVANGRRPGGPSEAPPPRRRRAASATGTRPPVPNSETGCPQPLSR